MGTAYAVAAATTWWIRAGGSPSDPLPLLALGLTVGNRSAGLVAVTPVPGIDGSETSGGTALDELSEPLEPPELVAAVVGDTTTSVALAAADEAPVAVAVAVRSMVVSSGADVATGTAASSS